MKSELSWTVFHPTDASTGTKLSIGPYGRSLGTYWHLDVGYHRTGGRKVHASENEVRKVIVRSAIEDCRTELRLLEAELAMLKQSKTFRP